MATQVSMEHTAVQGFLRQLEQIRSDHNAHYSNTHGEISARIAQYKGDGGTAAQGLLPLLDEQHAKVVNTMDQCHEVLTTHLSNNTAADAQQHDALRRAQSAITAIIN